MVNSSDAVLATNAIYNSLRDWRFHGGFPVLDIMSDDTRKGSNPGDGSQILAFDDFTYTPSEGTVTTWYQTMYVAIRRANVVVERVPNISMDETLKNRLIAEARFMRGFFYFKLVQLYGDVPLILTTSPEFKVPRTPKDEIYNDVIIPDLEFAVANLPEKSQYAPEDLGRVTKGTARAMLARMYLFRSDFVNAEKYALEVINSGQYSLDPSFSNTFSINGEFNQESIFEIGALPFGSAEGGHQYGNTQGSRGVPNKGWGFNRPTLDLINSFDSNDPRMEATVLFLGETLDGVTVEGDDATPDITYADPPTNSIVLEIECYNQKVYVPGTGQDSWDHNVRVIRYADVLLMAAEALNENGNATQALTYLNQVRARARGGNPSILPDVTTTNQDALRNAILDERRFELALEQLRFFDLVRTGRAPQVLGPLGFTTGKNEVFPIPQSEIDLSEGLLIQNPGY